MAPRHASPQTKPVDFTTRALAVLKRIPRGRVTTYGRVAALAGSPRGARQVVRILHTLASKEKLPWHRVVNGRGLVALPPGGGFEEQCARLRAEGVEVSPAGKINLARYGWGRREPSVL
jgi:methylated-DNA-protein-cysteine methyltransferase-like protein